MIATAEPGQPDAPESLPPSEALSGPAIRMMPIEKVVALYRTLKAPPFAAMHGEYAAALTHQGSRFHELTGFAGVNWYGRWLCKAFEPLGPSHGHGYNAFLTRRGVARRLRMRTCLGPSKLPGDAGDAFHLQYAPFNDFSTGGLAGAYVHTMFDEVRQVRPGLYLGIGRLGFTRAERSILRPFTLEGPVGPFVPVT